MKLNDTKPSLNNLLAIIEDWRNTYHHDTKPNDIVFQNIEHLANVRFTNTSYADIHSTTRGIENLPETLMHPSEIWSYWADPIEQMDTMRNYILLGESGINYVVVTKNGEVVAAKIVHTSKIDRYRKGLILLK